MLGGRFYVALTGFQSVGTAAQDLIEIQAGSSNPFILHGLMVSQNTDFGDAEAEGAQLFIKRGKNFTSGSGGGSLTVNPFHHDGTAADSFAVEERNNTTQATAGAGSLETIWEEAMNIQQGWQWYPEPAHRPFFYSQEGLILSIGTVADAVTLAAMALIEELG